MELSDSWYGSSQSPDGSTAQNNDVTTLVFTESGVALPLVKEDIQENVGLGINTSIIIFNVIFSNEYKK